MASILQAWRTHRTWRQARLEAKHLVAEARRILKKKSYRIPQSVSAEIEAAAAAVSAAGKGSDLERMRQAIATLDEAMDRHLAFARKSTAREYAESIGVALAVALLLRAFVVEAFQIPSGSMIPTLEIGDHIFVAKFSYAIGIPFTNAKVVEFKGPERGDVVVFRYPLGQETDYIKRVVGLPGDRVEMRQNQVFINETAVGRVHVDGACEYEERSAGEETEEVRECDRWREALGSKDHDVIHDPRQMPRDFLPALVPARHVFVMGDNRDNSNDSRVWGTVPFELVKGRALVVWWSRDPARGGWSPAGVVDYLRSIRWRRFFSAVR